jgi:hypothetical protein
MGMLLSTFWPKFCRNIQASQSADIALKTDAINNGQSYLLKRCIELLSENQIPKDFLSTPTNIANSASVNYVSLPDDFVKIFSVWRQNSSTNYTRLDGRSIITYDQLCREMGENRFDTSYTGDILLAAVNEPYLYFDKYFSEEDTDKVKIEYYQQPADIVVYDSITVLDSTDFAAGNIVEGGTSNATATIYSVPDSTTINIYTENYDGTFSSGETITDLTSAASTTISSITEKPATLKLTSKYQEHLIEACGLQYHILRGSDEIDARSLTVDNMIRNIGEINKNRVQLNWGFM